MFWNDLWGPERSYVCGSGSFLSIFQSSSSEGMKLTPMKKGILEVVIITQVNDVGMSFFLAGRLHVVNTTLAISGTHIQVFLDNWTICNRDGLTGMQGGVSWLVKEYGNTSIGEQARDLSMDLFKKQL